MCRSILIVAFLCGVTGDLMAQEGADRFYRAWSWRTDNTWSVTSQAPADGWNSDPNFSEAAGGWQPVVAEDTNNIWHSSIAANQSPNVIYFRRVFYLEPHQAEAERAAIFVHFDDDGEVWINGTSIVRDGGGGATSLHHHGGRYRLHCGSACQTHGI
ncbi:MAG: hypothetical protein AAF517_04450 [Planctomycetota bacterium]